MLLDRHQNKHNWKSRTVPEPFSSFNDIGFTPIFWASEFFVYIFCTRENTLEEDHNKCKWIRAEQFWSHPVVSLTFCADDNLLYISSVHIFCTYIGRAEQVGSHPAVSVG